MSTLTPHEGPIERDPAPTGLSAMVKAGIANLSEERRGKLQERLRHREIVSAAIDRWVEGKGPGDEFSIFDAKLAFGDVDALELQLERHVRTGKLSWTIRVLVNGQRYDREFGRREDIPESLTVDGHAVKWRQVQAYYHYRVLR